MKIKNIIYSLILLMLTIWKVYPSLGQRKLPLDPNIRYGKLHNGLTYYIKSIEDCSSETNAYLLVKAGSANEDPDQYALSHFLEHIVLKGGKNMSTTKAMRLGFPMSSIQANTSVYFTQFYLTSINTLQKRNAAFQLFQDIIWNIDFKPVYINTERPVLKNEMVIRGVNSPSVLMMGFENAMINRGAKRPKSINNHLDTFPIKSLKRFYNDWYRPDLMSLVIIGKIENIDQIENQIITKFSKTKSTSCPRNITKDYKEYINSPSQIIKHEYPDKSKLKSILVNLYIREGKNQNKNDKHSLNAELKRKFLINILMERYKQKQESYGINYSVYPRFMTLPSLGLKLQIVINENGNLKHTIFQIIQVLKELEENGISEDEFKSHKEDYLLALSIKDTTKIAYWWENIRSHILNETSLPAKIISHLKSQLIDLNLNDFNTFIKNTIKIQADRTDLIMLFPHGDESLQYSEKTIKKWIKEAEKSEPKLYSPPKTPNELISSSITKSLTQGAIEERTSNVYGVFEYYLANGVKVVLNPINLETDGNLKWRNRIIFQGVTPEGVGCYSGRDYYSALNAANIIKNSGVGKLNKFELNRYLKAKGFNGRVFPYINYHEAGIKGETTLKNLETAFQLIYLYFTSPNKNTLAFEDWKSDIKSTYSTSIKINEYDFKTKIKKVLRDSSFLPQGTLLLKSITKTDLNRAFEIYKNIFNNVGAFTFIFMGDFPKDQVLSLCSKYLGNIPIEKHLKSTELSRRQSNFTLPEPHTKVFNTTVKTRGVLVELVYTSEVKSHNDWKKDVEQILLQRILNKRVNLLRFEDGAASYAMAVGVDINRIRPFNGFHVVFRSSERNVGKLINQSELVINSLKDNIIDKKIWDKEIMEMISYWERKKSNPSFQFENLYNYYNYKYPYLDIKEIQDYLRRLTSKEIQKIAKQYLSQNPFEFRMKNIPFTKAE